MSFRRDAARFGPIAASLLLLSACTVHRLPRPTDRTCGGAGVDALWACIGREPVPSNGESGFTSSIRAASVVRKRSDQDVSSACGGRVPPGFESLPRVDMPAGRAPLHALWSAPGEKAPILIVVHGLYDSKFSKYVRVTSDLLREEGFGVLAPDMRWHGCLLTKEWLPTLGVEEGRDLVAWARWLRREHPGHPVGLVGFSLGGLSVLHAMGEPDAADVFDAGAIVLSPAGALPRTMDDLDSKAFLADRGFTFVLRSKFRGYLRDRSEGLGMSPPTRSFRAFLGWLAEHGPFPPGTTLDRLLAEADPAPPAARTRRPLLVVASRNDPIISPEAAGDLARAARENPYLRVIETPYGGHIGQIGLFPEWTAAVLVTFFRASPSVPPKSP